LTVWKRKFWQFWKGNFDSFGKRNFDSLEKEILTVQKGKFWQFGKEIFDNFRDTVNFLGDTQFGNHCVNVTVFCRVNLFLLSNQVSVKLTKIIQCSKNYMIKKHFREKIRGKFIHYAFCMLYFRIFYFTLILIIIIERSVH
jgi:hypothetical protein